MDHVLRYHRRDSSKSSSPMGQTPEERGQSVEFSGTTSTLTALRPSLCEEKDKSGFCRSQPKFGADGEQAGNVQPLSLAAK